MAKKGRRQLTENETKLFQLIQDGKSDAAEALLNGSNCDPNSLDEHGMSLLMAACFKGSLPLVNSLISLGADVNCNEHEHGYTTLHFAALAGAADVCQVLLDRGVKAYRTNGIGRTAAEMAAFTGQHHCVSVINNFLSNDDVMAILQPKGSTDPPRVPLENVPALHELSRTYNVHPVKYQNIHFYVLPWVNKPTYVAVIYNIETCMFISAHANLLNHAKGVLYVFDELFERQMKQKETNEVMAFKLHIILHTMRELFKFVEEERKREDNTKSDCELVNTFAKMLLRSEGRDHWFAKQLEHLVRRAVQKFPYHQSVLFQTVLRQLAQTEIGKEPTAINVLQQVILGNRMAMDATFCATCGEPRARKRCAACKMVNYCSSDCQKFHWFEHKRHCSSLAEKFAQMSLDEQNEVCTDKENEQFELMQKASLTSGQGHELSLYIRDTQSSLSTRVRY